MALPRACAALIVKLLSTNLSRPLPRFCGTGVAHNDKGRVASNKQPESRTNFDEKAGSTLKRIELGFINGVWITLVMAKCTRGCKETFFTTRLKSKLAAITRSSDCEELQPPGSLPWLLWEGWSGHARRRSALATIRQYVLRQTPNTQPAFARYGAATPNAQRRTNGNSLRQIQLGVSSQSENRNRTTK